MKQETTCGDLPRDHIFFVTSGMMGNVVKNGGKQCIMTTWRKIANFEAYKITSSGVYKDAKSW